MNCIESDFVFCKKLAYIVDKQCRHLQVEFHYNEEWLVSLKCIINVNFYISRVKEYSNYF